jgi:hypothetical protein
MAKIYIEKKEKDKLKNIFDNPTPISKFECEKIQKCVNVILKKKYIKVLNILNQFGIYEVLTQLIDEYAQDLINIRIVTYSLNNTHFHVGIRVHNTKINFKEYCFEDEICFIKNNNKVHFGMFANDYYNTAHYVHQHDFKMKDDWNTTICDRLNTYINCTTDKHMMQFANHMFREDYIKTINCTNQANLLTFYNIYMEHRYANMRPTKQIGTLEMRNTKYINCNNYKNCNYVTCEYSKLKQSEYYTFHLKQYTEYGNYWFDTEHIYIRNHKLMKNTIIITKILLNTLLKIVKQKFKN